MIKFVNMVQKIEKLIWQSRYMVFLAVIAAILSALIMIVLGCIEVVKVTTEFFHAFTDTGAYEEFSKHTVSHLVSAIDYYLIGTVFLIFGIGLYELFISKIDIAESDETSSKVLVIHDLDSLKEKIAKVVIMVLIVTFFKYAINFRYDEMINLLYLSIGILLIAVSIFITHNKKVPKRN
ncbi:MAG: YqhA family protein [Ignavibacteria bacterium]|nr:YqhA family protein [Ignavibacteria bacterium]